MDNQLKKISHSKYWKKLLCWVGAILMGQLEYIIQINFKFWPDIDGEFIDDVISCCKDGLADIDNIFLLQVGWC